MGDSSLRPLDKEKCDSLSISPAATALAMRNEGDECSKDLRRGYYLATSVFMLAGTTALLGWNVILSCAQYLTTMLYPDVGDFMDTATPTYFSFTMATSLACLAFGKNPRHTVLSMYAFSSGIIAASLSLALCVWLVPGANSAGGSVAVHILSAVYGTCGAGLVSVSFNLASVFRRNYCAAVSCGMAIAGVTTFFLWMLASLVFFDLSRYGVQRCTTLLLGVVVCIATASLIFLRKLMSQTWVKRELFEDTEIVQKNDLDAVIDQESWLSKFITVMRASLELSFLIFLINFAGFLVFPLIGPLSWRTSDLGISLLMGTYQICDLIGRYLLHLLPGSPTVPMHQLKYWTGLNLIFPVMFILSVYYKKLAFFSSLIFLIPLMAGYALAFGILWTAMLVNAPSVTPVPEQKGRAAVIAMIFSFLGIVIGQWLSAPIKTLL